MAFQVFRCWVSNTRRCRNDAGINAVMLEAIKLENEGWQRDPPYPSRRSSRAVISPDVRPVRRRRVP